MPNQNFTTADYGLANWLAFNRVELLGAIEYPGETRKSFVFSYSDKLQDLIDDWETPHSELAQICKRFFQAHTLIKKSLKESMSVTDV